MLGEELRRARLAAGLTQEELGHRANVDRGYISELENGHRSPTLDMLFRLCDAMGASAGAIVTRVEQRRGGPGG